MARIGEAHGGLSVAEVATAWARGKGTVPIIGVTKTRHIDSQVRAAGLSLTEAENDEIEQLVAATGVEVRGGWEKPLQ